MSPLKVIIPLFIVLGLLQAAILSLPFIYWRFAGYMGPINKFLFGSFFPVPYNLGKLLYRDLELTRTRLFLAFIAHPFLIITLITFTIAPSLLSLRHSLTSRLSTAYTALLPASISRSSSSDLLSSIPFLSNNTTDYTLPKTNRDWLLTALSSYVGWKTLGTLPSLMILLVVISLCKGREADGDRGWFAKGLKEEKKDVGEKEKGVAFRSTRTDVQVVG